MKLSELMTDDSELLIHPCDGQWEAIIKFYLPQRSLRVVGSSPDDCVRQLEIFKATSKNWPDE